MFDILAKKCENDPGVYYATSPVNETTWNTLSKMYN